MEIFGIPSQALFGQLLIGLINGSFYALLSLGLAVIFGLLNIINFTHGAQYMLGAFVAYLSLQYLGLNYWVSLLLTPLLVGATGVIIERTMLARQHGALNDDAGCAHQQRREQQRYPVVQPQILKAEVGHKSTQHVLGAVGEVDDVQQAENHGQAQREQGIKGAIDQADQQLPEQGLGGNAKNFHRDVRVLLKQGAKNYFLIIGQSPSLSGRKAWSAGMVARSL